MQIINLEATISTPTLQAEINTPSLQVEMRTLRLGGGGTIPSYNDLPDKPKIEGVTLQGNVPISALGLRTSDLINDSGFITTGDIPTKTSDLTNDSDYQTGAEVAASISAAIPTNVSSFTNDVGYITNADIPTNVSSFTNDAGYLTSGDLPSFAVDSVNGQTGAVTLTGDDIQGSIQYGITSTVGQTLKDHEQDIILINTYMPRKTSDLTNDSGFITAAGAPVQSVNGQTGTVILKATDLAGGRAGYADISNAGSGVLLQYAADNTAVAYMTVEMIPIQASGTPTPSDPLPITGLTDVVITVTDSESNQTTTTIPLGQTVYGGELNVTTGELTITHGFYTFDGTESWDYVTNSPFAYFRLYSTAFTTKINNFATSNQSTLLTTYTTTDNLSYWNEGSTLGDLNAWTLKVYPGLCVRDDSFNDASSFATSLIGQTFVYKLATPVTVNLTPAEIKTYSTFCAINVDDCNIKYMRYFTEGSEFLAPQVKTILEAFNLL